MNFSAIGSFVKQVYQQWSEDKASQLAAALSYYAIFSIAPLLLILSVIIGRFFDDEIAQISIQRQIRSLMGSPGVQVVEEIMMNANDPTGSLVATILSIITLIFGASGVFVYLQTALNTIWDVEKDEMKNGMLKMVKDRFFSFLIVLGVGFLLLLSLLINTILAAATDRFGLTLSNNPLIAYSTNIGVMYVTTTIMFALIFKIIPDAHIKWRDVIVGAMVTAAFFIIGKSLIGLYVSNLATDSIFGAFGSLIALSAWVYYSAQILFLGAEFTQVYANKFGSKIMLRKYRKKKKRRQEKRERAIQGN